MDAATDKGSWQKVLIGESLAPMQHRHLVFGLAFDTVFPVLTRSDGRLFFCGLQLNQQIDTTHFVSF